MGQAPEVILPGNMAYKKRFVAFRLDAVFNALEASLEGKVKAEAKDEFKIDCVHKEGADAICVEEKWHMCASSGCPKDGTFVK